MQANECIIIHFASHVVKMEKNQENKFSGDSDDEMFEIPRKKSVSLLKQLEWTEQMYCIQHYLEHGTYPHFYLGPKNREKRRDFRRMVKKSYTLDKTRKVLMKLVNMKKLDAKQWLHKHC